MSQAVKKTPFHDWHKSHGAHMVNFAGWEMPLNYGPGIVEEHLVTRRFGGLFDISHMGRFRVAGDEALPFLQYLLTNNAAALDPGQAQYTIISNDTGGAIDDAYLYRLEEKEFLLVVNAANAEKDWAWLQEHLPSFASVILEDHTGRLAMVALQGSKSKTVLEKLLSTSRAYLPEPGRNHLRKVAIDGVPTIISRTGYTGEPLAFELFMSGEKALFIWEKIFQVGQAEGIIPVGLGARDTLRLEAGLPLYGHEFGTDAEGKEIPVLAVPTAKIAVSFSTTKGRYIGKEALWKQFQELKLRQEAREDIMKFPLNVPRRIFPVALLSEGVARPNSPVFLDDRPVGILTSGTMVPYWPIEGKGLTSSLGEESRRRAIALAYIDAGLKEGQVIQISGRGKMLSGQIVRRFLSAEAPPYARPVYIPGTLPGKPDLVGERFDLQVQALIQKTGENHLWRQSQTINLIPSEQTSSPLVRLLSIADPCARYAEHRHFKSLGDADIYYYQGTAFIEEVEAKLRAELAKYLSCSQVETRIISGQMANAAVFSALVDYLNRFDRKTPPRRLQKVMNHHLGRGGHLSSQPMGALRDFITVDPQTERPAVVPFPVLEENPYQIDLQRTETYLHQHQPELIILGKSMVLYREPLAELRRLANGLKERPWIIYDMAHVLGLIGPHFQLPFQEGADIVTGSTHKTFFGTQRGVIGYNFDENSEYHDLGQAISRRTFPGSLSNHHLGTLLGLLLASYEMNAFANPYQKQIVANAKSFAQALKKNGLTVEGDPQLGFTETHQVLLRVGYARGSETARWLEENNLIVNFQALPDDEGFSASSGLRMGVQEMTRFGMKERDFEELAGVMADSILHHRPVRGEVVRLRSKFIQMHYCLSPEKARPLIQELQAIIFG
jgi:aminomethyltransferase